jgi:DUF3052 family protein
VTAEKDYSATLLGKKLGIKEGSVVNLVGGPPDFQSRLRPLPPSASVRSGGRGRSDVVVLFASRLSDLSKRFVALARSLAPDGGLWVAYPKKAAGVPTDLTFENVQRTGLDAGLVDNKSCAIDETWTALRFVYRLKDRPRS